MTGDTIGDDVLEKLPAFRGMNTGECHQLREIARQKSFKPGERVLVQGKSSQYLWFVLEGECQVIRDAAADGPLVLAELGPNSLFGEMSFFSPAPHSANVVAKTPVKLLSIARADYDDLVREGVPAAYKLAYNIVEGLASKLRRMDERMAELEGNHLERGDHKQPEWLQFREKLLGAWNL